MKHGRCSRTDVETAVENLRWAGLPITARRVYKLIGRGSMSTVLRFLRELNPPEYFQRSPKEPTLSERVKVLEARLVALERKLSALETSPEPSLGERQSLQ